MYIEEETSYRLFDSEWPELIAGLIGMAGIIIVTIISFS